MRRQVGRCHRVLSGLASNRAATAYTERMRACLVVLALAGCHADSPAAATRPSPPRTAPTRTASSAPAAPALEPEHATAPDIRELVRALAEGVEVDEPRTTEDHEDPTRSALTGVVRDLETGETLAGVTVIAASPAIPGEQAAISDESGNYALDLLPATYTATFYYADRTIQETDLVLVRGKQLRLAATMPPSPEVPPVPPPPDSDYESIPVPGRTFDAVLGAAAGSQEDSEGVSFSSHCGIENVYVVDD
jgi:hypothetical protein